MYFHFFEVCHPRKFIENFLYITAAEKQQKQEFHACQDSGVAK